MEWLRQIYRVRVLQDVGSGNGLVNRVNRVPIYQSIFQVCEVPMGPTRF